MCITCGCNDHEQKMNSDYHNHEHSSDTQNTNSDIILEQAVLEENNKFARQNLIYFTKTFNLAINLLSSPGSGKTTLLENTIKQLKDKVTISVIEGDQHTSLDAERIRQAGANTYQINTGKACHLDAHMLSHALAHFSGVNGGIFFIENVGNLICPALFDLGEHLKVVIISITEGEDKPLKYPYMFYTADLVIINKIDLLPYLNFDIQKLRNNIKMINYKADIIELSGISTNTQEFSTWLNWLQINYTKIFDDKVLFNEASKTSD